MNVLKTAFCIDQVTDMLKAIVCVDQEWSIGRDNDLLFHIPKDMAFFKQTTKNKIVICGRKTLESFPGNKPLPGRSTICLCSQKNNRTDCYCVNNFEDLLKLALELAKTQDVYVIGGAQIYELFLPYYDEVLVTKVQAIGHGTTFFPNLDSDLSFRQTWVSDESLDNDELKINFCTYRRVSKDANN